MTRRRQLLIVLAVAGVLLLGVAARYAYWDVVEHRFTTIAEGRVYQSGTLPPDGLVDKIREYGIRTVIDLRREPPEVIGAEQSALEGTGARYVNLPTDQVPEESDVDAFLNVLDPTAFPVLIHCEHGYGRSVLFSAIYRIEFEGWENEQARCGTRLCSWWGSFKPGSPKGEYLRSYRPRR